MRKVLFLILIFLSFTKSIAQPVVGSTFTKYFPVAEGRNIALPQGRWVLASKLKISDYGFEHPKYILINKQVNPKIFAIILTPYLYPNKWRDTNCTSPNQNIFQTNSYGTTASQLLNKCSGFYQISNFDTWRDSQKTKLSKWWDGVQENLVDAGGSGRNGVILAELTVQKYSDIRLVAEVFIAPPVTYSAIKIRDLFKAGDLKNEHQIMNDWAKTFINSMESTFFNKSYLELSELNYPVIKKEPPEASAEDNSKLRIIAEQKTKEQQRIADETRLKEQQRLALEMTEISKLRAEAEEAKRKQAELEEQLKIAKQQNQTSPASAITTMANRKALVIGNDSYKSVSKLLNAREDAKSIASSLASVGYQVTLKLDLNEKELKAALRAFSSQIQGGDEVMFFFAGHGVQLGAANYLLPTDIGGESEAQVKDEAIQLQRILEDMTEKKAKFTLAMIDACRDNPFKSTGRAIGGRGLAPTTAATGQMVVFSAGSGQQALDRLGTNDKNKNGVFTRTFLKEMQKPGISIDRIVKNVRNEVAELAKTIGHEQVPAIYDQVLGDFYFKK
jgi:hypothetical protein